QERLRDDLPVILDGAVATELERRHQGELKALDHGLWGTGALYNAPRAVLDVHRRYVEAGCDVISTNTWSILGASALETAGLVGFRGVTLWMDVARLGLRMARQVVEVCGHTCDCADAYTLVGDVVFEEHLRTLRLLLRVLEDAPPDILFFETMGLIRDEL